MSSVTFLNPGDNTATGPGLQAGRIGLRGAATSPGKVSTPAIRSVPFVADTRQQAEAVNNT